MYGVQRLRIAPDRPPSFTVVDDGGSPVDHVEAFLAHLEARGASPHTVESYAHDLKDFCVWLDQSDLDFKKATVEQLSEFFAWLRRPKPLRAPGVFMLPGLQPAVTNTTLVRKRAALAAYYRFHSRRDPAVAAVLGEFSGQRPMGAFKPFLVHLRRGSPDPDSYSPIRIHAHRQPPSVLTAEEIDMVVSTCIRLRDRFLVLLLDKSGLRISEALGLRHSDLRLRHGEVVVEPREDNPNYARVKRMKSRVVPVDASLFDAYADYMEGEYETLDSDFVFVNLFRGNPGAPMTRASAKDLFGRLRRRTGITHLHAHAFRHTYATRLLRERVPIEVVSNLLGHSSTQTTLATYGHLNVEDYRQLLVDAGFIDHAVATK